jgi:hypothetical protein
MVFEFGFYICLHLSISSETLIRPTHTGLLLFVFFHVIVSVSHT